MMKKKKKESIPVLTARNRNEGRRRHSKTDEEEMIENMF